MNTPIKFSPSAMLPSLHGPARLLACFCLLVLGASALVAAPRPPAPKPAAPTPAPPPAEDLAQVFTAAQNAFTAGDFPTAAAGLEKIIAQASPDAKLEAVYYLLGASYFNLAQYPKAITTLRTYRTKFPGGARIAEATFSLGQACLLSKDTAGAVEAFKALENNPAYREQALLQTGLAQKEAGQIDAAVATLEKLVGDGIRSPADAEAALVLAQLRAQKKEPAKSVALITQMQHNLGLLDNAAQFNALATSTGDALLEAGSPKEALACYRAVQTPAELVQMQTKRIGRLRDNLQRQTAAIRADPKNAAQYQTEKARLTAALNDATGRLAEFKKLPDAGPALLVRMATCYARMERRWEAITVYDELLRRYPDDAATRESALFGEIVTSADAERIAKAHDLAVQYTKDFPAGQHLDTVEYLLGALAIQTNDLSAVATYFGKTLEKRPKSAYREAMLFQLGNAQFAMGEYDKAQATYAKYLAEFRKGESAEEAVYRTALCAVFSAAYEKAMGLLNDYVKAYPKGVFLADARYRLAVCLYAASQNDEVIAACRDWEKQFRNAPLLGEVLSLEADALAAKGDNPAAIETYVRASKAAASDEVSDYAVFAAQKLLQKAGDWNRIAKMFEEFVREHPDRPSAVMAVYWIGKAESREGRTEEAKHFIADTIKKYIADPKRDAVEQLISQLANLCTRKKTPPATSPSPAASPAAATAEATPAATPTPAAVADATPAPDPGAEMDGLLGGAETDASPLARARVLFAKAELARSRRQTAAQDASLEQIATSFKPQDLSAPLLALTGDYLLGKGRCAQAAPFFAEMMSVYPKNDLIDFAYNGLGEAAYQAKDYPKALQYFTDAVDKAGATAKLKEVTVGRAKTLLAMGRLDEAKKLFEQISSMREWRGDSTAFAVYSLGDIMRKQGKLPEAVVYYQRVYVAYQKYLPWVAKAYIASAECFEQMGKKQEAANTYREMVNNPKLRDFAETGIARDHLQNNG